MKSSWVWVGVSVTAVALLGCSKDDGDVNSSPGGDESEPLTEEEALDELCDIICDALIDCETIDESKEDCVLGCGTDDSEETSSGDCESTRNEVDACAAALNDSSCEQFNEFQQGDGLESVLPEACKTICDGEDGDHSNKGGPPTDVDVESSVDYCGGYANPPCSDAGTCDGGYCSACTALLDACDANDSACENQDSTGPVVCELEWVDCIYAMNCGDTDANDRASTCKDDYDSCLQNL